MCTTGPPPMMCKVVKVVIVQQESRQRSGGQSGWKRGKALCSVDRWVQRAVQTKGLKNQPHARWAFPSCKVLLLLHNIVNSYGKITSYDPHKWVLLPGISLYLWGTFGYLQVHCYYLWRHNNMNLWCSALLTQQCWVHWSEKWLDEGEGT